MTRKLLYKFAVLASLASTHTYKYASNFSPTHHVVSHFSVVSHFWSSPFLCTHRVIRRRDVSIFFTRDPKNMVIGVRQRFARAAMASEDEVVSIVGGN